MSLGTLGLAFLAGALSVLSPCVLPLLPIMVGSAGERASFRAGRARRGAFALVRRHWPVRCHRGVCRGPRHRLLSPGVGDSPHRRRHTASGAEARRPSRRSGWTGEQLGRRAIGRLRNARAWWSVPAWPAAWSGVEPLRRADAWRRLDPRPRARISERCRSPWSPSASARPFR